MDKYLIGINYQIDDALEVNINFIRDFATPADAKQFAEGDIQSSSYLHDGFISFNSMSENIVITDKDVENYYFSRMVKVLPALDISSLNQDELLELISNDTYMITPDDYERLEYSISDIFQLLKTRYPQKSYFVLESLAYMCRPLKTT